MKGDEELAHELGLIEIELQRWFAENGSDSKMDLEAEIISIKDQINNKLKI